MANANQAPEPKKVKHKREPDSSEHKKVGDETSNPLPDDEAGDGGGGTAGDPGRN